MDNYLLQILISLVSSIIGGGILISWIEFQRLRREKEEWKLKDKKIDLKLLSVEVDEFHWNVAEVGDEKEKLRIYETGLNNKVKEWLFLIKIAYSNLTDRDIIITMAELEIPMPIFEIAKMEGENKKNFNPLDIKKYDLMNKNPIYSGSFPLVIPQKSTTGIVFMGHWYFPYPYLVSSVPSNATFKITLDDGNTRQLIVDFSNTENISELAFSSNGIPNWEPALSKFRKEIEEEEDIPF